MSVFSSSDLREEESFICSSCCGVAVVVFLMNEARFSLSAHKRDGPHILPLSGMKLEEDPGHVTPPVRSERFDAQPEWFPTCLFRYFPVWCVSS